jgi:hypothetical protein
LGVSKLRRSLIGQISGAASSLILYKTLSLTSEAAAQGMVQGELSWGGLGYSVPESDVERRFPQTTQALKLIGGTSVLVEKLVQTIRDSYLSGKGRVKDLFEALEGGESLVFCVAFDYEQIVQTPAVGEDAQEDIESFLYCQAQVIYVEPPGGSAEGGDFRILYSFPFRVQYNFRNPSADRKRVTSEFSKNFFANEKSLLSVFQSKVATKKFKEKRFPKALRVSEIRVSDEFRKTLDFVKITESFKPDFVGNVFSTSLSEVGGMSVIPYQANQLLGITLAKRFKRDDKILRLAANMGGKEQLDYSIEIEMHRLLRKITGENEANVRIARGMSCFITLKSVMRDQELAKVKISLITDVVLDRLSFSKNLQAFDLRYMIQIVVLLFDTFVDLVISGGDAKYETLGLKKNEDEKSVLVFKKIFNECIYEG